MQNLFKRNIKIYYLYTFLTSCMLFGAILIPFYKDWGGLNQTKIQLLQSIFMISVFLFEIPTGVVADFFGRKQSLILGAAVWILGILVYASTPNFWIFAFGECCVAIGTAFISGANQSILYDSLKILNQEDQAKKIISRGEIINMTGILSGNLLGSFLTRYLDLNIVFALSAVAQVGAFTSALFFVEPVFQTAQKETKKWLTVLKSGMNEIIARPKLRIMTLDIILTSVAAYYVVWFYQVQLLNLEIDVAYFGLFSAVLLISEILVLHFQNKFEKLFKGERSYLLISVILSAIGFIAAGLIQNWIGVILLLVFAGGFGLTRRSIYIAIINKFIKSDNRATSISTISLFRSLATAIANPFIGLAADWNLQLTFLGLGISLLMISILSIKATKEL